MNLKTTLLTLALAAPVFAQQLPIGPPVLPFEKVRQFLTLSDTQFESLRQVMSQKRAAESAIYQQINDRQRTLNALLADGSNDTVTVGRLMVEINNLRRQLPVPSAQFRAAATAVLTDAQRAKLPALAEALRLSQPAYEAVTLNLVDLPQTGPTPRPMPLPATLDGEPE